MPATRNELHVAKEPRLPSKMRCWALVFCMLTKYNVCQLKRTSFRQNTTPAIKNEPPRKMDPIMSPLLSKLFSYPVLIRFMPTFSDINSSFYLLLPLLLKPLILVLSYCHQLLLITTTIARSPIGSPSVSPNPFTYDSHSRSPSSSPRDPTMFPLWAPAPAPASEPGSLTCFFCGLQPQPQPQRT